MDKKYVPIACGLYDELEVRALKKQNVWLTYRISESQENKINCVITDLFSKNKIEYLKTDSGIIIRLDDILSVDNIPFNKSC